MGKHAGRISAEVLPYRLRPLSNRSSPSVPLFLELVKQLLDPAKYRGLPSTAQSYPAQLAASLVRHGVFSDLRTHILAFVSHPAPFAPLYRPG